MNSRSTRWVIRAGAWIAMLALVGGCAATATPTDAPPDVTPTPALATAPAPSPTVPGSAAPTDAPSVGRWEEVALTDDLPRQDLHAVLLGDGRVLVLGYDEERQASDARLWDPATDDWQATTGLERKRTSFAAVGLADGRAIVVGGYNESGESYSSIYAFDPSSETWTRSAVMDTARTSPSVALLDDGRVLIAGGYYYLPPSEGAAPGAGITLAASVAGPAHGPGSTAPPLDDVDVPPHGYALATAEIFDPRTGAVEPTGPMTYARAGASAVTLRDGRVLIVGSAPEDITGIDRGAWESAEIYDPATGRFALTESLPPIDRAALEEAGANPVPEEDPAPASPGTAVALPDGGALLVAHQGWWKHVGDVSRTFRLDPSTLAWREADETYIYVGEPTANVLTAPGVSWLRGSLTAPTPDGSVIVAGGAGEAVGTPSEGYSNPPTDEARLYDPSADAWTTQPPMPGAREFGVAVVLADGSILFVGGSDWSGDEPVTYPPLRFVPGG